MPRTTLPWLPLALAGSVLAACGRQAPVASTTTPVQVSTAPSAPKAAPVVELPSMMIGTQPGASALTPAPAFGGPAVAPAPEADDDRPEGAPVDLADFSALSGIVAGQVIVQVRQGATLGRGIQNLGVRKISTLSLGDTFQTLELPSGMSFAQAQARYLADPAVVAVLPNRRYGLSGLFDGLAADASEDPYLDDQWGYKQIKAADAAARTQGDGVTVAVLDTGIDYNHPDLAGRVLMGWNFADKNKDIMDRFGHGTHVAGIIGAAARNGVGIAGVAPKAYLMAVKVLGDNGEGSTSTVLEGIKYAADYGAKVINMSLGSADTSVDAALSSAIAYARSKGCVVVCAAGNSGGEVGSPANDPGALAVSSTSKFLFWEYLSGFSNRGAKISVAAPGAGIWSTVPLSANKTGKTGYAKLSGTSMACPMVAAEAALIAHRNPSFSVDAIQARIEQAVDDKGSKGRDSRFGFGRIRVDLATQ
ncbi:MAG: S8 family serine peptidase [Candidatus Sericytochromatia bacterium]|nr:S8 family serine peptidase [Candidatus Sericytochromatia bacterium]